ncbi:MAG: ABC transporter permease [Kosmotogaceae bacterium]
MNKVKQFLSISSAFTKETFRNKVEVFFTFFFPLIFLIMFGTFFGGSEKLSNISAGIYIDKGVENVSLDILKSDGTDLLSYQEKNELYKDVEEGTVDTGIIVELEEIIFIYKEGDISKTSTIKLLQNTYKTQIEEAFNHVNKIVEVSNHAVSLGESESVSQSDFIMAGVIAISILSSGLFSVISIFGYYKEKGVLKRIIATPIRPMSFVMGATLSRLLMSFLTAFLMLGVNRFLFRSNFSIKWMPFLLTIVCSTLGMMSLGLILVMIFTKARTADSVATALFVVMLFFSGVYFSLDLLPRVFQYIAMFMPVKYVAELMRFVTGVENISWNYFFSVNAVLFISGIILIQISASRFLRPD